MNVLLCLRRFETVDWTNKLVRKLFTEHFLRSVQHYILNSVPQMGEDVNLICVSSGCSVLSLQGHHSFALYLYIVSGWDFIALRQVQLFLFPFFCVPSQHRCCRVRMLEPGSTLTAGLVQSGSKLNQTGFFSFSVHVHASVFSRSDPFSILSCLFL